MASENQLESVLLQAQASQHLERTKGIEKIKTLLQNGISEKQKAFMCNAVMEMFSKEPMESKLGAFNVAMILIPTSTDHSEFLKHISDACRLGLEDKEPRIRQAVGDCIYVLAAHEGTKTYELFEEVLIDSIRRNFERDEHSSESIAKEEDPMESLLESTYRVVPPGTGEMRHGTEGWKSLETSFRALLKLIQGAGQSVASFISGEIWELVLNGFEHPNRFIREISFSTLDTLIQVSTSEVRLSESLLTDIAKKLAKGLGDDWSQVRYSASIAARTFMVQENRKELFQLILPQMCLNRYYVAEGVRLYSQASWKLVVDDKGRDLVAQYALEFVNYYILQCGANNHAVREAACGCIAELMTKISKQSIQQHVPRLITALVNCFKDASWPVRDAACLACGKCVLSFPEETKSTLDELYTLWIAHLADNISSVREDSAIALGNAIRAYQDDALVVILPQLRILITEAKNQKPDSKVFTNLKNVSQFGVAAAKVKDDDDDEAHTNQTMFSCGSLAPKLARGGGCIDHGFKREKEPWEVSDGSIYLLRELSYIYPDKVLEFIPSMTELAYLCEFGHAGHLHETLWKCFPVIGKNIGKRNFKIYLQEMLDALFRSLRSEHQLEVVAATGMVSFCSEFLGRGIFRGRLSTEQAAVFDTIVPSY